MIETKRPGGKRGIVIAPEVYEELAGFIVHAINGDEDVNLVSLLTLAEEKFPSTTDINWLVYHTKLDLEAKGIIKTVFDKEETNSIRLRLTSHGIKRTRQKTYS